MNRRLAWLVWRLPGALFLIGLFWVHARVWLWVPSLFVAGVTCIVNARGCGRRHCLFTGPLYLLGVVATLIKALGIAPVPWSWIIAALLAGTAIAFGFEYAQGKYLARG